MQVENDKKPVTRKKFVLWGAAAVAALSAAGYFLRAPVKKQKIATAKMLTEDGTLVEVEVAKLPRKRKKASIEQLQNWVHRKTSSKI